MSISAGTIENTLGTPPATCFGVFWAAEELGAALAGPIASLMFDNEGTADIAALLESVPGTDFVDTRAQHSLNCGKFL